MGEKWMEKKLISFELSNKDLFQFEFPRLGRHLWLLIIRCSTRACRLQGPWSWRGCTGRRRWRCRRHLRSHPCPQVKRKVTKKTICKVNCWLLGSLASAVERHRLVTSSGPLDLSHLAAVNSIAGQRAAHSFLQLHKSMPSMRKKVIFYTLELLCDAIFFVSSLV